MSIKSVYYMLVSLVLIGGLLILDYFGVIWHNSIFAYPYQVKGIDVSHHQGKIDWETLRKENPDFVFAYIKATEGQDFEDEDFEKNWNEAKKNGFVTGAYHFFSMQSKGKDQAKHYISKVPKDVKSLPPVIDLEISLYHDPNKVKAELQDMINQLDQHYGKETVFYVTYDTYETYIKDHFKENRIWIRDIIKFPTLDGQDWEIWQYGNRGHLEGINGYVDLNVYQGSKEEFEKEYVGSIQ